MSGFTTNGVVARIQQIEESAWLSYTCLAGMLQMRNMDRKTAVLKIFKGEKETASFKWAWAAAQKTKAFGESTMSAASGMAIEDAMKFLTTQVRAHMTSLGVNGKNAYNDVMHFTDGEALRAANEKKALDDAADAAAQAAKDADEQADADGASDDAQEDAAASAAEARKERDLVAEAAAIVKLMTMAEANKLAILLTERLNELALIPVAEAA